MNLGMNGVWIKLYLNKLKHYYGTNLFLHQQKQIASYQNKGHPCSSNILIYQAEAECSILTNKNNVFGPCFGKVNAYLYFQNCLWDYCTSLVNSLPTEPALCNAFEAMSRECALNSTIFNWRSPERCRKKHLPEYLYEYK